MDMKVWFDWPSHADNLARFHRRERAASRNFDLHLECRGGGVISAHRMVLAAAANYFVDLPDSVIQISFPKFDADVVTAMVDYAYSGHALVSSANVGRFLLTCKALGVKGLDERERNERQREEEEEVVPRPQQQRWLPVRIKEENPLSISDDNKEEEDDAVAGPSQSSPTSSTARINCPTCGNSCPNTDYLRNHLSIIHHKEALMNEFPGSSHKSKRCPICKIGFKNSTSLIGHLGSFHKLVDKHLGAEENIAIQSGELPEKRGEEENDDCTEENVDEDSVVEKGRKKKKPQRNSEKKKFACPTCRKSCMPIRSMFRQHLSVRHYRQHLRKQVNEIDPMRCGICSAVLATKPALLKHLGSFHKLVDAHMTKNEGKALDTLPGRDAVVADSFPEPEENGSSVKINPKKSKKKEKKELACPTCQKSNIGTSGSYRLHLSLNHYRECLKKHVNATDPRKCLICESVFVSQQVLLKHLGCFHKLVDVLMKEKERKVLNMLSN